MTKLDHLRTICLLIFGVLVIAALSCSQKPPSVSQPNANTPVSERTNKITAEQIAKTYGLDSFGQVEAIRYTWNAQFPGLNISRAWIGEHKTTRVYYEGKNKNGKAEKATYIHSHLDSQPANVKN